MGGDLFHAFASREREMRKPKIKEKFKELWAWLKREVFTKNMLFAFIVSELIFWSPCIVLGILAVTIDVKFWVAFGAVCAFWAAPLTPAVPLQIGLAVILKKLFKKRKKHNENNEENGA